MQPNLRLFLVWRWAPAGGQDAIIYTLAILEWSVSFLADTFVAGHGVTRIAPGSGIDAELFSDDARIHDDPIVVDPIANPNIVVRRA